MKKFLIGIFAVALALPAMSQITVGGSLGLTTMENATAFSINPEIGYKQSDKLAFGVDLSYEMSKNLFYMKDLTLDDLYVFGYLYGDDIRMTTIGAGIFVRCYFPITDRVTFALKNGASYGGSTIKADDEKVGEASIIGLKVAPEFWFSITNTTSICASLGSIGYTNIKPKGGDSSNVFGVNWNSFSLGVGFAF